MSELTASGRVSAGSFPSVGGKRWQLAAGSVLLAVLAIDPVRGWLRQWPGRWFHILAVAALVTFCLVPLTRRFALRVGAVDLPDRRKVHDRPTPRLGGVALFAGIAAALSLNGLSDPAISTLVLASAGLLALGVAEDAFGVPARVRLAAQIVAAWIVTQGGIVLTFLPHQSAVGEAANVAVTVFWLVGITNAFNFFDGMDGLASGLAVVMTGILGAIALGSDQTQLGWASAAIIGACLGFLPFNFRLREPAAVFLGDGGSTVLGFLLAGLAVHGEWAADGPWVGLVAPLLVFGVLIYDMIHTTVCRIVRGDVRTVRQWLEYTGRDHLHHRFESLLRSKRRATVVVWLLAATLGLTAVLIRRAEPLGALVLLAQCVAILVLVTVLEHGGNLRERRK